MTFMHVACIHSTVCLSVRESERFTKQDLSPGLGVWSQVLGVKVGVGGNEGEEKEGMEGDKPYYSQRGFLWPVEQDRPKQDSLPHSTSRLLPLNTETV